MSLRQRRAARRARKLGDFALALAAVAAFVLLQSLLGDALPPGMKP